MNIGSNIKISLSSDIRVAYIHASELTDFSTGTYIHATLISRDTLIFMLEPIFMRL